MSRKSDKLSIVIPTKGRHDAVKTQVRNQILIVDKSEQDLYKSNNECEIDVCPDFKSLSKKRNWILERFGNVFMIDDDIVTVERMQDGEQDYLLTPAEAELLIKKTADRAIDIGCYLFGFNNDANPAHYNAMKPFMLKGFINGCAMGLLEGGKLFFSEKVVAAEDYWINLLNAYKHRTCLIDKRYVFKQEAGSTFIKRGGQAANRTLETEKMDSLFLRSHFGESIQLKKKRYVTGKSTQYERSLNIRL